MTEPFPPGYPLGTFVVTCGNCGLSSTAAEAGWERFGGFQIGPGRRGPLTCPKCGVTSIMRTHQVRVPWTRRTKLRVVIATTGCFVGTTMLASWLVNGHWSARFLALGISLALTSIVWAVLVWRTERTTRNASKSR